MEQMAIQHATMKLNGAKAAVVNMQGSNTQESFAHHWSTFLNCSNGVFLKLEKGARNNARSRQWFGAEKRLRKEDDLLNYLHQARNADEHGIEHVFDYIPANIGFGIKPGHSGFWIKTITISNGRVLIDVDKPEALQVENNPAKFILKPVYDDRNDRWYSPPENHLGSHIRDASPTGIAQLSLPFLSELVDRASMLPWLRPA